MLIDSAKYKGKLIRILNMEDTMFCKIVDVDDCGWTIDVLISIPDRGDEVVVYTGETLFVNHAYPLKFAFMEKREILSALTHQSLYSYFVFREEDIDEKFDDIMREFAEVTKRKDSGTICEDMPISDLNLTYRSYAALMRNGITTVAELVSRTRRDLINMKGLGSRGVDLIEEALLSKGLFLKK